MHLGTEWKRWGVAESLPATDLGSRPLVVGVSLEPPTLTSAMARDHPPCLPYHNPLTTAHDLWRRAEGGAGTAARLDMSP